MAGTNLSSTTSSFLGRASHTLVSVFFILGLAGGAPIGAVPPLLEVQQPFDVRLLPSSGSESMDMPGLSLEVRTQKKLDTGTGVESMGGPVGPWTVFPLDNPGWAIYSAAWSDAGFFWGVGQDRVFFSADGATWTQFLQSPVLGLFEVAHSGGKTLAAGNRSVLSLPDAIFTDFGAGTVLVGITEAWGRWVTVGGFYDGSDWQDRIYVSQDNGESWSGQTTGSDDYLLDVSGAVVQGFPQFVAVGIHGRVLTSPDGGDSWTPRAPSPGVTLNSVVYGGGVWIAVGHSGTILRSTSGGISWTDVSVGGGTLAEVFYGDGRFVAVGQDGRILSSNTGQSWIVESSGTSTFLEGVTYGGGYWLASGIGEVTRTTPAFGLTPPGDGPGGEEVPPTLLQPSLRAAIDYSDDDFADALAGLGTGGESQETVVFVADKSGISGLGDGSGNDILNLRWTLSTDRVGWQEARVAFQYSTPEDIVEQQETLIKLYQAPSLAGPWTLVPNQLLDPVTNEVAGSVTELGHFALTIAQDPACPGTIAYLETFEAATTIDPTDLGFSVEDLAGAGVDPVLATWLVANDPTLDPVFVGGFESLNATNYAIQFGDPASVNDDWLISPGFFLESTATYLVQLLYEAGAGGASDLQVYLGTGNTSGVLAGAPPIAELQDLGGIQGFVQALFTPQSETTHHLGLRELSNPAGTSFYSSVDDLVVAELSLPGSPAPEMTLTVGIVEAPIGTPVLNLEMGSVDDSDHPIEQLGFVVTGLPSGLVMEVNANPEDGSLTASVDPAFDLPPGDYLVWLNAVDPCGRAGTVATTIRAVEQTVLFADGFESGDLSAWTLE